MSLTSVVAMRYCAPHNMLACFSDLHLTEMESLGSSKRPSLAMAIRNVATQARDRGIRRIELLLLGDIFEILRSPQWVEAKIRPWDKVTDKHCRTVRDIVDKIVAANESVFREIVELRESGLLSDVHYVPGNHDRPLATEMGGSARARLAESLPGLSEKRVPATLFMDEDHQVIARHGNEWDPSNRGVDEAAAVGDAIVVDLLVQIPLRVASQMGLPHTDRKIAFLWELGRVRPAHPRVIAQWIRTSLLERTKAERRELLAIIDQVARDSFRDVARRLRRRPETLAVGAPSMAMRLAITSLARVAEYLGALRIASWIPGADHPARSFASRVVSDAAAVREYPGYEFFLCGHTHHAEAVVLDTGPKGPGPRTYINCGTWGVVHQYAGTGLDSAQRPHRQFSSWQETSYATIHTPAEQAEGNPPFALFRQTEATTGFRVLDS